MDTSEFKGFKPKEIKKLPYIAIGIMSAIALYLLWAFIQIYKSFTVGYTYKIRGVLDFFTLLTFFIVVIFVLYINGILKDRERGGIVLKDFIVAHLSKNKILKVATFILIVLVGTVNFIWSNFFASTQIGNFYEKKEYSERYYVLMSDKPNIARKYRLPADIYVAYSGTETFYTDENGNSEEGFSISGRGYFLEKIYFPNGGYLSFNEEEVEEDHYLELEKRIYPNKETKVVDVHGKSYYVELTTTKAN